MSAIAGCQPPRLASEALAGLYEGIRERTAAERLVKARRALAVLAQAAVERCWISEGDIGQALAAPYPHLALNALLKKILDALCRWLWEVTLSHAPAAARLPEGRRAPFLMLRLACSLDEEADGAQIEIDQLIITGACQWDFRFSLEDLPLALARAVYQALRLLAGHAGEALLTEDLAAMDWMHEDLLYSYRQLQAAGVADDPAAALEVLERLEESDGWGVESAQDIANLLRQMALLAAPPPAWTAPDGEEEPPTLPSAPLIAARLLERVWDWRRAQPDLYRHPWTGFVRRAAAAVRRLYRRKPPVPLEAVNVKAVPDEDAPLAYSCYIGGGGPWAQADSGLESRTGGYSSWEDYTLQGILETMMQVGEEPRRRLLLSAETLPEVLWRLEGLATMAGLLLRAEYIQARLDPADQAGGGVARDETDRLLSLERTP